MLFSGRGSKTTGTRPLCLIYSHMFSELGLLYESKLLAVWSTAHWCLKNNKTVLRVPRGSGPHISLLWTLEKMVSGSEWGREHRRGLAVSACRLWVGTIISRFRKPICFLPFLPFHPSLAQLCYKENRETCHLFDHHHGVRICLSPVWDNGWIFRFSVDAWQLRCVSCSHAAERVPQSSLLSSSFSRLFEDWRKGRKPVLWIF